MPVKVIVAGAGLAGLSAAFELGQRGCEVVVIEARPRPGGRVWTERDVFGGTGHGELGGEFVDADHRRMRRLIKRFGLTLVPVLRGGFVQRLEPQGQRPTVMRTSGWDLLARELRPLVQQYRRAAGDDDAVAIREMSTWSLREWLRREGASAEVHAAADALRGFFVAEPEELSVLQLAEQLAQGGSPVRTKLFRIEGGNSRLVDALLDAARPTLLYRRQVRTVAQTDAGVRVAVETETGRVEEVTGDYVVVAVPATTARTIAFDPPLPEGQRHAIASVTYGCATKAVVRRPPGSRLRGRARAFATDGEVGAFWDATEGQLSDAHTMLTFLAGGRASASLRRRAQAGPAAVLAPLCWLGGAAADADGAGPVAWVSWEHEPLNSGAYAYLSPAFDPAWRAWLSRRWRRVVFAGEHTSADRQGYMEGAVQSGADAARKILEAAA